MAIEKFKSNIEDYLHLSTEAGDKGTKIQDWQDYQRNVNATIQNIIGADILWQPNTSLAIDNVVRSPNMVAGTYARVTKAGTTAAAEPVWTGVGTTVTDGTVTYVIYPQNLDFATDDDIAAGTAKNKMVTPAQLKSLKDTIVNNANTNYISRNNNNVSEIDKETVTRTTGVALSASTDMDDIKVQYGNLLTLRNNLGALGSLGDWIAQLLFSTTNGQVLTRASTNGGAFGAWKRLLNTEDKSALVNQLNSINSSLTQNIANVKSQAGVVAGNVSNANAWWVKLGGTIPLIIQGGTHTGSYTGNDGNSLNFPISFPSACISLTATRWYYSNDSNHAAIVHIISKSTTGAVLEGGVNDGGGGYYYRTSGQYSWIAFGY